MTKIISIDVGIKNLAFCLYSVNKQNTVEIIKWDVIDLSQKLEVKCCELGKNGLCCLSPVKFVSPLLKKVEQNPVQNLGQNQDNKGGQKGEQEGHPPLLYYCLKHAKKHSSLKVPIAELKMKSIQKLKIQPLTELAKKYYLIKETDNGKKLVKSQIVSLFQEYLKDYFFENVDQINATKLDLVTIGKNMLISFDEILQEHISTIDLVLIENQISPIANRMKTIQGMISQYFIMRNLNINIEFISSANKLKDYKPLEVDTDDEDNSKIVDSTKKSGYSDRKKLGIKYCLELLNKEMDTEIGKEGKWTQFFTNHKKKDDLADSFLQGIWFLQKNYNLQLTYVHTQSI